MKNFRIVITIIFLMYLPAHLYAEAVFLKNGTILEGKIKKDTDKEVTITIDDKDTTLLRKQIIRVLYGDDFKNMQFIFLNDDSIIEAYIVEENRDSYIYRKILNSPRETTIKKEKIKFISKKKITLAEMQKKKKRQKLLTDRENKFRNLLGLRLGAAYLQGHSEDNQIPYTIEKRDGPLFMLGLYYYDKYFEFDWQFGFNFDEKDRTISHTYMFNLYPFNMFNIGIGFIIGYTKLNFNLYVGETEGFYLEFDGIMMGLIYRHEGWFRIGFGYLANAGISAYVKSGSTEEDLDDDGSYYNFFAFVEVFVWKNLSLSANYYYTETNHKHSGTSSSVNYRTHYFSLFVSFGLNIF